MSEAGDVSGAGESRSTAPRCKRTTAGEQLVENRAETEDVAALVERRACGLLGRHIGRSARAPPGGSHGGIRVGVHGLRKPEVEQLGRTLLGHHDVGRLQVAMQDAAACASWSASAI